MTAQTANTLVDPNMIRVLDLGYVRMVEAWGAGDAGRNTPIGPEPDYECGLVEAARQSTQGAFRGWLNGDEGLLRTLAMSTPPHPSPFEFAGMTIEVQAPILVFREWHRHRTLSYNEMSARYAPLPDLYYLPDPAEVTARGIKAEKDRNRQAKGVAPFNSAYVAEWLEDVQELYAQAESIYRAALENGIPKELARVTMPVGHYSRMRASGNLRNWLAFLVLRMDPNAQWEIRQYAVAVATHVARYFPRSWLLHCERNGFAAPTVGVDQQ